MKHLRKALSAIMFLTILVSCSQDVNTTSNSNVKPSDSNAVPTGVVSTVSYSKAKVQAAATDTYNAYIGIQNNSNANWFAYDQKLFLSLNGQDWSEQGGSFSVKRGTETFYLRPVAESLCIKDGIIYKCTSASIYRNTEMTTENSYIVEVGPSCSDIVKGCTTEVSYSQTIATQLSFNYSAAIRITNPLDVTWTTIDQKLFISFDGQNWVECPNSGSFSIPRGISIFYLKPVTINMCNKDGSTYYCTSISVYKNTQKTDSQSFVLKQ